MVSIIKSEKKVKVGCMLRNASPKSLANLKKGRDKMFLAALKTTTFFSWIRYFGEFILYVRSLELKLWAIQAKE